jgi:NADH dehydrogenase [ubiquinone] 1 alpha subcomplex assembly factor 5
MVTNDIVIFDREQIKRNRIRAARTFSDHDFLHRWSKNQLLDRLSDVNRIFSSAACIGSRCPIEDVDHEKIESGCVMDITPAPITPCTSPYINADEEFLPFAPSTLDLVISNLNLHNVNDLPGSLLQIRQALKNDGLFLASILGGETLHELRNVMMQTELEMYGGISPRVAPFADKPQMGDLLQRAGFALPVVDSDIVSVTYDNIFKLMADLRGMGEGNAVAERRKSFERKDFFMQVAKRYNDSFAEEDGRIVASFEVIFLLGWTPDASQQKPLPRGSAKHSLAEALGSKEYKTGDKATP